MSTPTIAQEFDALDKQTAERLIEKASDQGKAGVCFMCKRIAEKTHKDEFPIEARKIHLMLCAFPKLEQGATSEKN